MRGVALGLALLAGCALAAPPAVRRDAAGFPLPERPVASIVSPAWSTEPDREQAGEAAAVIKAAGVRPGMTVADIGAGEGYYTLRLAKTVGAEGRVVAEDIVADYAAGLRRRLRDAGVTNVEVILGAADDAKLPAGRFDRIFLIHMYHEIAQPYALMWRLRAALKPGGRIVIVDADRGTDRHGTPPALLRCEIEAVGYRQLERRAMPEAGGYFASFGLAGAVPAPDRIAPCPT